MVLKYPDNLEINEDYSRVLPEIYGKIPEGNVTLKEFLELMGEPGKLILSMLLAAPFLIPISIPGTGVIAGLIVFTLSISLIFNRDLIPHRFQKTKISNKNLVRALNITSRVFIYLKKYTKPRLLVMTSGAITPKLNKFFFLLSSLLFIFPLPVPLTDTLPAAGVFFLAAGTLECDGYLILAGYFTVIITLIYFGSMVLLGLAGISSGLSYFGLTI